MLRAARIALSELRDAVRDIGGIHTGSRHTVRIWTQCSTNYQWLPPVLRAFRRRQPSTGIALATVPDGAHIDALVDGEIDIAIVSKLDRAMDRVRLHELFDDEMLAIVASEHPWARKPHLNAEDFGAAHLVMFDSYDPARVPAVPLPIPDGAQPNRLTLLPQVTELVIETVIASDAVTVLPSWTAAPSLASGRVAGIQVGREAHDRTWYAATRRGGLPEHIAVLVDVLRDALGRGDHIATAKIATAS